MYMKLSELVGQKLDKKYVDVQVMFNGSMEKVISVNRNRTPPGMVNVTLVVSPRIRTLLFLGATVASIVEHPVKAKPAVKTKTVAKPKAVAKPKGKPKTAKKKSTIKTVSL